MLQRFAALAMCATLALLPATVNAQDLPSTLRKPDPIGNVIQRQIFLDKPNEKFILTQTRDVVPTGHQNCGNRSCSPRINNWEMSTASPLYFSKNSVKITCNEKIKNHCALYGKYQILFIDDQTIKFTTTDASPDILPIPLKFGMSNTYTVSADLMIKEPKFTKRVFDPQNIYSGIDFYVNVSDGALETELIGYHKKYGPFIIDPLNFDSGYGIKKIGIENYPGGKILKFSVED